MLGWLSVFSPLEERLRYCTPLVSTRPAVTTNTRVPAARSSREAAATSDETTKRRAVKENLMTPRTFENPHGPRGSNKENGLLRALGLPVDLTRERALSILARVTRPAPTGPIVRFR